LIPYASSKAADGDRSTTAEGYYSVSHTVSRDKDSFELAVFSFMQSSSIADKDMHTA
jgi:hypothetical protein